MTEEESNHYFEVAKEIIDKYFEEKKLLKECRQTGRTTATTEKVLKTVFSQMKETDTLKVLIEGDTATINGIKYKRVEEPKPKTLLNIVYGWCDDDNNPTCEELVNRIKKWLPDEHCNITDYDLGWNDVLRKIKDGLG
jgi:acid phosphatase class B